MYKMQILGLSVNIVSCVMALENRQMLVRFNDVYSPSQ